VDWLGDQGNESFTDSDISQQFKIRYFIYQKIGCNPHTQDAPIHTNLQSFYLHWFDTWPAISLAAVASFAGLVMLADALSLALAFNITQPLSHYPKYHQSDFINTAINEGYLRDFARFFAIV